MQESLQNMVEIDQQIRSNPFKNKKEMEDIDLKNHEKLKEIVNEFGLIDIIRFGEAASHNALLLIQHTPLSKFDFAIKYLKLVEENLDRINKRKFAYLKDRVNLRLGEKQFYGTQFRTDFTINKIYFNNLYDPGKVDERRANVELEPLSEYILKIEETTKLKVLSPSGYKG